MEIKLVVLKLFLDALGVRGKITTVDDRKRVQKAVYLGQLTVDLGYRFGWYLMGPYCPSLTRDYYALAAELDAGSDEYKNKSLNDDVRKSLKSVAPLLKPPSDVALSQEDWLELLASTHFLRTVSRLDHEKTRSTLHEKKPHVAGCYEKAVSLLKDAKLLN